MNLAELKTNQLAARKARETIRATLLTTLIGEVETNLRKPGAKGEDEVLGVAVKSFLKRNTEFLDVARHPEQRENLLAEKAILEALMPAQVTESDLVLAINTQFPVLTIKDKGAVMKFLKGNFGGSYDGAMASRVFDTIPKV